MPARSCDIVLLLDSAASMAGFASRLGRHVPEDLVGAIRSKGVETVRVGLVAVSVARLPDRPAYRVHTLLDGDRGPRLIPALYAPPSVATDADREQLFTTDPGRIAKRLASLPAEGGGDMLVGLDLALDFPFAPAERCTRVIVAFTPTPLEQQYAPRTGPATSALAQKAGARHVTLWAACPNSRASHELVGVRTASPAAAPATGAAGVLPDRDLTAWLRQVAKTTGEESTKRRPEAKHDRGLFGQASWRDARSVLGVRG